MKNCISLISFILLAGFIACKKKDSPVQETSSVQPFVEYRDAFTGIYKGTEYTSQDINYNGMQMPPDSVTKLNVVDTISKSLTNDSNIISRYYKQEFHIDAAGQWKFKNKNYAPLEIYNFRHRNDSIYFYRLKTSHMGPNNYYYTFIFNGKKQ